MINWFLRLFDFTQPLGEIFINLSIAIVTTLFFLFWVWRISYNIVSYIFRFLIFLSKKIGTDLLIEKIYLLEDNFENLYQKPIKLFIKIKSLLKRNKIKYVVHYFIGITIPIVGISIWYSASAPPTPYEEYLLITTGITSYAIVTRVEESADVVEEYDGRRSGIIDIYDYQYSFKTNNNEVINCYKTSAGIDPSPLYHSLNTKQPLIVEFLKSNPQVNRIKDIKEGNRTISQWLRFQILTGGVLSIILIIIAFYYVKISLQLKSESINY